MSKYFNISFSEYFALCLKCCTPLNKAIGVIVLSKLWRPRSDRSLKKQSDQGLHCLSFHLLILQTIVYWKSKFSIFRIVSIIMLGVPIFRDFLQCTTTRKFCWYTMRTGTDYSLVLQLRVWKLLRWSNHQKLIKMMYVTDLLVTV